MTPYFDFFAPAARFDSPSPPVDGAAGENFAVLYLCRSISPLESAAGEHFLVCNRRFRL